MNYTSLKSAKLTLTLDYLFCVVLAGLMVFAYPFFNWFFCMRPDATLLTVSVLVAFYICCVPAWTALVTIAKLMKNIMNEEVFTENTVFLIRLLSWCCAAVSFVCFAAGFIYKPLWFVTLAAAFMMLILRVLKSVMAKATEMKNENELTI
jgi:hypothetical protein